MVPGRRILHILIIISLVFLSFYIEEGAFRAEGRSSHQEDPTRSPGDQIYPEPNITLIFDKDEYETDPHPFTGGDVVITGVLICVVPSVVPPNIWCKVTLDVISTQLEYSSLFEYNFNQFDDDMDVSIYMRTHLDLRGGDIVSLEITADWIYEKTSQGGRVPESFFTRIYVPVHGYVEISTFGTETVIDMDVGEWKIFEIEVSNRGNRASEFAMTTVEIPDDVEIEFEENVFSLNSYQTKFIKTMIRQGSGDGKEFDIRISVSSDLPGNNSMKELNLSIRTQAEKESFNTFNIGSMMLLFFILFCIFIFSFFIILWIRTKNRKSEEIPAEMSLIGPEA